MSFVTAAIWSVCAIAALDFFLALVVASASSPAGVDLVSRVLCEAAAFVTTLLLLTLVHERERPLKDVLGLRRPPIVLLILAVLFGVALQGPVDLIAGPIYDRYPLPDDQTEFLRRLFDVGALPQKVAIVVAAGLIGPVVEELLFRGGIFKGVLRKNGPWRTVVGISIFFALAHGQPRDFLPDLLGGLAMGYVRLASGSIWPAILLHGAFNTTSVLLALTYGPEVDVLSHAENLGGAAVSLALLAAFAWIAGRSERCAAMREVDREGARK